MRQSSAGQPIAIGDGFYCSDLSAAAGKVDSTIEIWLDRSEPATQPSPQYRKVTSEYTYTLRRIQVYTL